MKRPFAIILLRNMEIVSAKYYVLSVSNADKTLSVLSKDESIKPGDLILIKGVDGVWNVNSGDFYTLEDLPLLPSDMLEVEAFAEKEDLSKHTMASMEKTSIEEEKTQEKEEALEEDFIFEEESSLEEEESPDDLISPEQLIIRIETEPSFSLLTYETDLAIRILEKKRKSKKEESTGYEFIKGIIIDNSSDYSLRGLTMRFTFSSPILEIEEMVIPALESAECLRLRAPYIKADKAALMLLDEPLPSSMKAEIISSKGRVISSFNQDFLILPIGESNSTVNEDARILSKFVTPNAEEIRKFTLEAASISPHHRFIAYQNEDLNDRAAELGALWNALAEKKIAYQNPPASTSKFQRVRLPSQVLRDHKGTCLDLAILYASIILEVGFHPILVLTDDHAMLGVFLNEKDKFENSRLAKFGAFYNRVTGKGDILLIDAVDLSSAVVSFPRAVKNAEARLRDYTGESFVAVDVLSAHRSIFLPISSSSSGEEFDTSSILRELSEERLETIIERSYHEVHHEEVKDRFTFWENKLLDLTEKNPLVSFRFSPSNFVKLISNSLPSLLKEDKPIPCRFVEAPNLPSRAEQIDVVLNADRSSLPIGSELNATYIYGKERQFRSILSKNQSEIEETGAPTLYLCLGLLTFVTKEIRKGEFKRATAPFMLLPVKIERKGLGSATYTMSFDYDDVMLNKTFFEYYKLEHPDFDMSPLYSIDSEDDYYDIVRTFKEHVEDDIKLDETAFFLANLTFSHYIMWLDMRKRKEELKSNKIIASILDQESKLDKSSISLESVEKNENYLDFAAPLPYDSTQLAAILESAEGKSFILDGPPGTGKSQTIVNMIVNAIYHGKSVLFVAEKKAALDVVAERLAKIKLDRFCLELHSNKANKRDFFGRLNESMRLGPTEGVSDFRKEVNELELRREDIRKTISAMHEVNTYCLSFFEAVTLDLNLSSKTLYFELPLSLIKETERDKYFEALSFLNEYSSLVKRIGGIEESHLKRIGLDFFAYSDIHEASEEFQKYKETISSFLSLYLEAISSCPLKFPLSYQAIGDYLLAMDMALNGNLSVSCIKNILELEDAEELDCLFEMAEETLKNRLAIKKAFNLKGIQMIEASELLEERRKANGFLDKRKWNKKVKKALKTVYLGEGKIHKDSYQKVLEDISSYQKQYKDLSAEYSHFRDYFPLSLIENIEDLEAIKGEFDETFLYSRKVRELYSYLPKAEVDSYFDEVVKNREESLRKTIASLIEAKDNLREIEDSFFLKYHLEPSDFETKGKEPLDCLMEMLEEGTSEANIRKLIDIAHLNLEITRAPAIALPFIKAFKNENLSLDTLGTTFEATFARELIKLYFNNRLINDFHPSLFEATKERYRQLIGEYSQSVIEAVTERATKNLTHGRMEYKGSSPIGSLKKVASSGGRGVSIRDTLIKYDEIIRDYFPCFLMSPLSAAQYLSVDSSRKIKKFDMVIFDEASQIPVHEAIGPIARGNSLIIAGDPQQMPPTTYFTSDITISKADYDYMDASSLLDECLAIDFPSIRLCYHYRSRHESLIDFSNKTFYDKELHTFPSSYKGKRALKFEKVELKEEKSDTRLSPEEIKAILRRLSLIYSKEENASLSVGIIVFNIKQKESLEKALETYLEKDTALEEKIHKAEIASGEPLFIKSIENVQGDERDIILLCIGFRKSLSGRAVIVGPLASSGGERRLNVAITRSKRKMYVISTIDDEDFDRDELITNKGALVMKHFLTYAKGEEIRYEKEEESKTSPRLEIVDFLRKDLERKGYLCDTNVGESKNKVDIAIRGESMDSYALGILIDDDGEVSSASLRDKEYVELNVFNSLEWKIVKVYAVSYYKDKEGTIKAIEEAMEKPYIRMETKIEPSFVSREVDLSYEADEYQEIDLKGLPDISYLSSYGFSLPIDTALRTIIENEGPIPESLIRIRIKEKIGLLALSTTAGFYLSRALRPFAYLKDEDGFYWPNVEEKNKPMSRFRYGGRRDITEIPYEEVACCYKQIIKRQGELSEDDLFKAALEAFHYMGSKLTKKNRDVLKTHYERFKEGE